MTAFQAVNEGSIPFSRSMTNKQILKKAIEKAVRNGWNCFGCYDAYMGDPPTYKVKAVYPSLPFVELTPGDPPGGDKEIIMPEQFILSHNFAKAFWKDKEGDEEVNKRGETSNDWSRADSFGWEGCGLLKWQYHLQQMVLREDPLKYIEKFL